LPITESNAGRGLSISVNDTEGGALVCLSGRVSIDSSPDLRERLHAVLKRQSLPALTIDLAELTYMDCSGVATLIEALRIARSRKTLLQLRGLRDRPRHLLEVTGLLRLFETNERTSGSSVSKVL
jgi:anti-sigma B factor antagonist